MPRIDSAYMYYMSTYGNQQVSRYDAHKKSDLRRVYNSIVKSNTESPLYKLSNVESAKRFAIDIKESAKSMQNIVASLSDQQGNFDDSFRKKVASSSDEDTVHVEYIGDGNDSPDTMDFSMKILKLATPQINRGNYLRQDSLSFTPGTYSFDLSTNTNTYEFQFTVGTGETNLDILKKLDHLMNSSNLGVHSNILNNENGQSALEIISNQTGLSEQEESLFVITPEATAESLKAMELLGINRLYKQAENSSFLLNGEEKSSLSNTFTVNNTLEISLNHSAPEEDIQISFKDDTDSILHNVNTLTDAFNAIVSKDDTYTEIGLLKGSRVGRDFIKVAQSFHEELSNIGITLDSKGQLSIDKEQLTSVLESDDAGLALSTLTSFKDSLGHKAADIAINPMKYVDKVVVAYKNPGRNFATPYITSIYSGLMLDDYI